MRRLISLLLVLAGCLAGPARAHDPSAASALSALPLASVAVGASAASALVAVPDGARASVEIGGRAVRGSALASGTAVVVSVVGTGVLLSAAGEAIAFIPNALGQALLHDERLTR